MTEQPLINLTIDGKAVSVPKGTTVYHAAKQLGIGLPIFCYQDRMPPFGACRVCLVEVEKMPKLQTSCTLEATEGMVVKTQSQPAVEGRKGILEFLLINHPLDCPICDRGGECPLQEQAISDGPGESRFFEEKRRFIKAKPLGPVLMLDRERCIICARCTRFGDELAGDHALEFMDRGFKTEVGTPDGGPAESKFIGNTIMICPVGALTSQVYRFRARPWDNEATASTCTLCPVGCSMYLDSRDGEVMRTRSRGNADVNDIWMCDKGWFGYEFSSSTERLTTPLIRRNGTLEAATWDEAINLIASKIQEAKPNGKLAAFGGNPLTVEENYQFQKLMRDGSGTHNVDHRIGSPIFSSEEEGIAPGMEMSIGECEKLNYAIFFGLDLTEEFPVIWLRLRQAINKGAKVIFAGNFAPEIAQYFTQTTLHAPGKEIETIQQLTPAITELAQKGKGAIFVGRQYLASPNRKAILAELQKLRQNTANTSLNIMEGRGNSMGARFAGMHPDFAPGGQRLEKPGLNALQVLQAAASSGWDFLYVAGANPVTQYPSQLWKETRSKLKFLVVQDLFLTETAAQADVVLPTLSYVEKGGTFLNIERRLQNLMPGKEIPAGIYSDGDIFTLLAAKLNVILGIVPSFSAKIESGRIPAHSENITNVKSQPTQHDPNTLQAVFAHVLFDHGQRMLRDQHLVKMAKEPFARMNPKDANTRNLKDDDLVSVNGTQVCLKIRLDKQVAESSIILPLGFPEVPMHELSPNLLNGLPIILKKEEKLCSTMQSKFSLKV